MEKQRITGLLVDTTKNDNAFVEVTFEDKLEVFYDLLNCRCIDIVVRDFGGKKLDVVCDDEGLLKEGNILSIATFHEGECVEQIVGNVLILNHDSQGNLASLSEEDLEAIEDCKGMYLSEDGLRVCLCAEI